MLIGGHIYPELRCLTRYGFRTLFKHKNCAPYNGLYYNQHYKFSNEDKNSEKNSTEAKNYNQSNNHV